jgi:predicted O-methyltransferase YrrM
MEHFYDEVYGFSQIDLFALYRNMAERFDSGSHFVEIGSFLGKSSVYMAVEIINSGKNIKFDCVDHWEGSEEHSNNDKVNLDTMYEDFLKNIEPVKEVINPIKMNSVDASKLYEPDSLDFVFIDASHDEVSVKQDLAAWMVRVKEDGVIAGDDINASGVSEAVRWFFDTSKLEVIGRQWMVDLGQ